MIGAGTIFTNDRYPRATTPDLAKLRPSDPDEHTLPTLVARGRHRSVPGARSAAASTLGRFAHGRHGAAS